MAILQLPSEQRVTLPGVSWEAYVGIGELLRDQPIRLTYDQGNLEIMTLSHEHEWLSSLFGRLLETLIEELHLEMHSGGSTTFRDEELQRGMEPDKCYWIQHEPEMRFKRDFDIASDPPPDLALEVEISRSALDRLTIYAAVGIPEVWRYDGETVRILLLDAKGDYQPSSRSLAFPQVPIAEVAAFLDLCDELTEVQLIRRFREWIKASVGGWTTKKTRGRRKS